MKERKTKQMNKPTKQAEGCPQKKDNSILKKVKSLNLVKVDKATIKDITDNIIDNSNVTDQALKESSKKLVANCIKLSISAEHPDLAKFYKKMDYAQLMELVDKTNIKGTTSDMLKIAIPPEALATLGEGAVSMYGTSFSISPNSF